MDKQTANRILYLTRYLSKLQLSKFLDISRTTFYSRTAKKSWKKYQTEKINYLFEEVKKIISEHGKDIIKMSLGNNMLFYQIKAKTKIKSTDKEFSFNI